MRTNVQPSALGEFFGVFWDVFFEGWKPAHCKKIHLMKGGKQGENICTDFLSGNGKCCSFISVAIAVYTFNFIDLNNLYEKKSFTIALQVKKTLAPKFKTRGVFCCSLNVSALGFLRI